MAEMEWNTTSPRVRGRSTQVTVTKYGNDVTGWKKEIASYYSVMQEFTTMDPVSVFQHLSQFSGRASEIRSNISADAPRNENNFRIRIIDPFIEECDRQFKLHSRIQAINEMDAKMAGGRFT